MWPAIEQSQASTHAVPGLRAAGPGLRPWFDLAALLILCGLMLPAFAQQQSAPLRKARLDMVFSSSLFHSTNRNDAIAAVRVWASLVGRKRGFQFDPVIDVIDDVAEIRKRVQTGSVGVLALDTVEYLKLADLPAVEPVLYAIRGAGDIPSKYLALVRADSGISSLPGLRGKAVVVHATTSSNLGEVWLDAMLHDGRLGPPERFFSSVSAVSKASAAILPVFFGKADGAVVEQASFDVTREMNPQVGSKLRVIGVSPLVAEGLICICSKRIEYREEFLEGMRDLHRDEEGRQILLVFQFSRLVAVQKSVLEQVRELWRKHILLFSPERPPAGSLPRPGTSLARRGEAQ